MNTQTKGITTWAIISYATLGFALFTPVSMVYKIIAYVLAGAAWTCSLYFNQDFTEEACEGTGYARYLKAQKNKDVWTEPVDWTEEADDEPKHVIVIYHEEENDEQDQDR